MRVVCDNCGAVYKIANEKLSKEVNRATCKRCGHKIVIYKPGSRAAEEAAAAKAGGRKKQADDEEERTVIKSVPELQNMAGKQGVPSIGSLTAELRAISIPGIQAVPAPKAPESLGPVGPAAGDTRPPPPPKPIAPPPGANVRPSPGIPPSDSPRTKVYNGPSPAISGTGLSTVGSPSPGKPSSPPLVTTGTTDPTRPLPMPPPPVPGAVPTNGSSGAPVTHAPPGMARTSVGTATAVSTVADAGTPVLGTVAFFALLGTIGLIAALFVPHPVAAVAYSIAGLGLGACMFLGLMTSRGTRPGRAPIAMALGFLVALLMGGLSFVRGGGLDFLEDAPEAGSTAPVPQPVKPVPPVTDGGADGGAAGLDAAELAEARRFSEDEVAGLAGETAEAPTPTKESKRDVVTRPPPSERTPARRETQPTRERSTPAPTPAPEPTPSSGPARAELTPPSDSGGAAKSEGPSPFVIDTIIRNNASIVRCLRVEEAKGVDLSGKIYLKFTIAPDGSVSKARVTTSRFAGTALDTCISRELNGLKFPAFDGSAKKITYPLIVQ